MLACRDTLPPFPPSLVFPDVEPEILEQEAQRDRADRGFAWLSFRIGMFAPALRLVADEEA